MQRTYYPKYVSYYGDGSGRDCQVIQANGGLTSVSKGGLEHHGVHFSPYGPGPKRHSPSPSKDATTWYYQSDGTGRDSYVLMDNGGLRSEYNRNQQKQKTVFYDTLRQSERSPLKYQKDPLHDRADITTYLNWPSLRARIQNKNAVKQQSKLIERLYNTGNSPSRRVSPKVI